MRVFQAEQRLAQACHALYVGVLFSVLFFLTLYARKVENVKHMYGKSSTYTVPLLFAGVETIKM